jgi:hypothetical protein
MADYDIEVTVPTRGPQGPQGTPGEQTTDASLLTSGTLNDARLSANVAFKDFVDLRALQIVPKAIVGSYYGGRIYSTAMSSHGMGQGNIRNINMPLPDCAIDRVGIAVSGAVAGGVFRLGVYSTNAEFYPTSLIADFGTVATDTTGYKELTVNQSFAAGVYAFALLTDTAATAPSYFGVPAGAFVPFIKIPTNTLLDGGDAYLSSGNASGSLPASFPTGANLGTGAPYFAVRFA